jgi:outer membrane protein
MSMRTKALVAAFALGFFSIPAGAQTLTLEQALEMSLSADPRIKEKEQVVEQARALLDEVQGNKDVRLDANLFVGLAPKIKGGFYDNGAVSCMATPCTPRNDGDEIHGLSDWTSLTFTLIKPLYTFGKIENYSEAAQGNMDVKRGDVRLARGSSAMDVKQAWYGYLAARDTRRLLQEVSRRVDDAANMVSRALDEENGEARPADLYSVEAARGLLGKYLNQAGAIERVSLDALKVLTGIGINGDLQVAADSLQPLPLPEGNIAEYQSKALADRPEISQLEAGLRARRALVEAKKSEAWPDIYAGVVGSVAYASQRDQLDHPYIYDPFNHVGATPVVGLKWDMAFGVQPARVAQAQAELEALNYRNQFALSGIPYEVSENYNQMIAHYRSLEYLAKGAKAARQWMVAAFADYNAGLERADRVAEALKTYATTQAEYLRTVYDYNLDVGRMEQVTGQIK